jgi:hypothetical protein
MTRIFVALIVSAAATAVLFIGAAMADGMCHCMRSMFTLFPYGSFVMMHFSSDTFGLPLALVQFPIYVLVVMLVKGMRWKLGVILLLTALHIGAASFAFSDYCQSRRTCMLGRDPTNRWTRAAGACFVTNLVRRRVL